MALARCVGVLLIALGACTPQQAVMALLPQHTAPPPRDPLVSPAPSQPPPGAAERKAGAGSTGKVDLGLSAVSLVLAAFGGVRPMFGLFGTFDESRWLGRKPAVRRQAEREENLRERGRSYTPALEESAR